MGEYVLWFNEIKQEHNNIVGKKCANLGELTQMGLNAPHGFAIPIESYRRFTLESGIADELSRYINSLGDLKGKKISKFDEISKNVRSIIEGAQIPSAIRDDIGSAYEMLCNKVGIPNVPVSVRSSGVESRPGMFETYLNVRGLENILENVKKVWSSAYTTRALVYRVNKGLPVLGDELGVAVVKMINARTAGVTFTVDPNTGDSSKIVLEANWGLGEGVVSGESNTDVFLEDKRSFEIIEEKIGMKSKQMVSKEDGAMWEEVPLDKRTISCLSKEEIIEISKIALVLEERLGCPQDVEWAIEPGIDLPGSLFLLQTRPAKIAQRRMDSPGKSSIERLLDLMAGNEAQRNQRT